MNHSIFFGLAVAAMLVGCGTHEHGTDQQEASAQSSTEHDAHDQAPVVVLDNGKHWKANPETTEGIANMSRILQAYDPATGNGDTLKASLENEFALIFERCTMQGKGHNQLHNYLIPVHHALREFDAADAAKRAALADHLAHYNDYFE